MLSKQQARAARNLPAPEPYDAEFYEILDAALATLKPREQVILDCRFTLGLTLKETQAALKAQGLPIPNSVERIRQLQNSALMKIRRTLRQAGMLPDVRRSPDEHTFSSFGRVEIRKLLEASKPREVPPPQPVAPPTWAWQMANEWRLARMRPAIVEAAADEHPVRPAVDGYRRAARIRANWSEVAAAILSRVQARTASQAFPACPRPEKSHSL